jgi:hypothetical protein
MSKREPKWSRRELLRAWGSVAGIGGAPGGGKLRAREGGPRKPVAHRGAEVRG